MKWITRERVKVARVACPWLIKKFVDPQAEFLFVPADSQSCHVGIAVVVDGDAMAMPMPCSSPLPPRYVEYTGQPGPGWSRKHSPGPRHCCRGKLAERR